MEERDWTQPPLAAETESLWVALHDAKVRGLHSDRLARELRLRIGLGFPRPAEHCPKEVELRFSGVSHALLFVSKDWPGPTPEVRGHSFDEAKALYADYWQKGRAETCDLETLNAWAGDEFLVEILQAEAHRTVEGTTVVLDGLLGSHTAWQFRVAAESLDGIGDDGAPLTLDALLRLGKAGWDEWARAAEARRSAAAVSPPGGGDEEEGEEDA